MPDSTATLMTLDEAILSSWGGQWPLDLAVSLCLMAVATTTATAYATMFAGKKGPTYARVEAAGVSLFLGRTPMQAVYWALMPLGKLLIRLGVGANAITAASLVAGLGAGAAIAFGHFGVAAGLAVVATLGDAVDGLVARATNTATASGATFDAAADRYSEFFFLGGLALHYHGSALKLSLVLFALIGSFMVSYGSAKAEALGVTPPRGAMRRAERAAYLTIGVALSPIAGAAAFAKLPFLSADAPVVLALLIVAVASNASAVQRLVRISDLVATRERRERREEASEVRVRSRLESTTG